MHSRRRFAARAVAAQPRSRRRPASAQHGQTRPAAQTRRVGGQRHDLRRQRTRASIFVIDEATEKVTREIPVSIGIPIGLTLSDDRSRIYVRDATYEKIEDHRSREGHVARHVHADRGQGEDAHLGHAARSAGQVPDPDHQEVHARGRSLGDRPADARAVRPRDRERSRARFRGRRARSAKAWA